MVAYNELLAEYARLYEALKQMRMSRDNWKSKYMSLKKHGK
jgi:hypothetical protein